VQPDDLLALGLAVMRTPRQVERAEHERHERVRKRNGTLSNR
jgi:hypothetical protein